MVLLNIKINEANLLDSKVNNILTSYKEKGTLTLKMYNYLAYLLNAQPTEKLLKYKNIKFKNYLPEKIKFPYKDIEYKAIVFAIVNTLKEHKFKSKYKETMLLILLDIIFNPQDYEFVKKDLQNIQNFISEKYIHYISNFYSINYQVTTFGKKYNKFFNEAFDYFLDKQLRGLNEST